MPRFVVLGRSPRDSRPVLRRYKDKGEIRDVFLVDSIVSKRGLYTFWIASESWLPRAFYLVSFDIEGYESKAYSKIKEEMMFNGCAYVDQSTYICPEEVSVEADRVVTYWVVPVGEARGYLRECFMDTFEWLTALLLATSAKVENADRRANRLRKAAESTLAGASVVKFIIERHREKFESIGINVEDAIRGLENAEKTLREALSRKWGNISR